MNRIRKKKGNRIKKFEVQRRVKMKIFEKKPQNGGTPAIENKVIIRILVKILLVPKSLKECRVFKSKLTNWNKV